MKRNAAFALLCTGLFFACNANQKQPPVTEPALVNATELQEILQATTDDWNRGDLAAFAAPYDTASTFMTRTGPIGKAQMLEHYRTHFFKEGKPAQNLRFDQVSVRPLGADHALMTGRYLLTGGGQPDRTGRFSLVWLRTPKGWKILHDHSS